MRYLTGTSSFDPSAFDPTGLVTNPVLILALVLSILVVMPIIARRLQLPEIVLVMIAGILVNEHTTGLLVFSPDSIRWLGIPGLLYIMFLSGLETSIFDLARSRRQVVLFVALTFSLTFSAGILIARGLFLLDWPATILLGGVISSHTLLAWPIISRLGLSRHGFATTIVGGTIFHNFLAMLVLAVIVGQANGTPDPGFWIKLVVLTSAFAFLVFRIVPVVSRFFLRKTSADDGGQAIYVLAIVFLCSFLSQTAGIEAILGAFTAGLALNRLIPERSPLMNRVQFLGNSLLVPLFLLSVGLMADLRHLANERTLLIAAAMTGALLVAKLIGAHAFARLTGKPAREGWIIFGLLTPKAAATLAAALVGVQLGIFEQAILDGTIVMMLVTCLIGPWIVEVVGKRIARRDVSPRQDNEQKFIIPILPGQNPEPLLELSLLLFNKSLPGRLYPLAVVSDDGDNDRAVTEAGRSLDLFAKNASAVNVPAQTVVRIADDFARGIHRASRELAASLLLLPWAQAGETRQFLDEDLTARLVRMTSSRLLLCRILYPVNTTSRMLLCLPPWSEYAPDFDSIMREIKHLCLQIGDTLEIVTAAENPDELERAIAALKPELPFTLRNLPDWHDVRRCMLADATPNDLVVVCCAREDTVNWRPSLSRLPQSMASRLPGNNMIFIYPMLPDDAGTQTPENTLESILPAPDAVACNTSQRNWPEKLRAMISGMPGVAPGRSDDLAGHVEQAAREFSAELRPGVFLVHFHSPLPAKTTLLVATSRDGLKLAENQRAARVVFILINRDDEPPERHLATLSGLARTLSDDAAISGLVKAGDAGTILTVLRRALVAMATKP